MKFAELMTLWKLKDMIKEDSTLSEDNVYNKSYLYEIKYLEVHTISMVSKILYSKTNARIALLHADIHFTSFTGNGPDQLFIKNAKVTDLDAQMR